MINEFAQIVGLLSAFSSGREAREALELAEFQNWLSQHNHQDIIRLIESDSNTAIFVKAYLNKEIPEIQGKLDKIIDLISTLTTVPEPDQVTFSGKHFLRGVTLLGLEHVMHSNLLPEDFEFARSYLLEMVGEHCQYNEYVLEKMVRDCLLRKDTASEILNKFWLDLTMYS